MANTLPGTPYVESSDLVANYPAVSESLAERVDLVGILPFATSTARGTALPTPTDGQYTYLQDTNSTEFWNGSAWQSAGIDPGLKIVSPTSIANSGGSASASGGAVTFTGVSSVSLNGVFTSTYQNNVIVINLIGSTIANLQFRMRLSGVDAATNYNHQRLYAQGTAVGASSQTAGTSAQIGVTNTAGSGITFNIFNAPYADSTQFHSTQSYASQNLEIWAGAHTTATAYDGISIITSGGNITGSIRVYGYKNS